MVRCKLCKQFDIPGGFPSSFSKVMALNRDFRAYSKSKYKNMRLAVSWYINHLKMSHNVQDKMIFEIYDYYEIIPLELCGDSSVQSLNIYRKKWCKKLKPNLSNCDLEKKYEHPKYRYDL